VGGSRRPGEGLVGRKKHGAAERERARASTESGGVGGGGGGGTRTCSTVKVEEAVVEDEQVVGVPEDLEHGAADGLRRTSTSAP
jgi:hypothetical protein